MADARILKKERNYGIDLLRIVSMLMVIMLHVLSHGGILKVITPEHAGFDVAWLMRMGSFCAVNCYALISGYVGFQSGKFKYTNIIYIWLQVIFISVVATTVFAYFLPEVTRADVFASFFPLCKKYFWYFNAYFFVFFFMPIFNKGVAALSEKQLKAIAVIIVVFLSIVPTFVKVDIFYTLNGYSSLWLAVLYILGAIIKKCNLLKRIKTPILFLSYFVFVFIIWLEKYLLDKYNLTVLPEERVGTVLLSYTSPAVLFCGIVLLIAFSRLKINKFFARIISFFAPLTFGVFLIHVQQHVWQYIMLDRFVSFVDFSAVKMFFCVLGVAVGIFLVCSMLDYIRELIFRLLHIRKLLMFLEKKIFKNLWLEEPKKEEQ